MYGVIFSWLLSFFIEVALVCLIVYQVNPEPRKKSLVLGGPILLFDVVFFTKPTFGRFSNWMRLLHYVFQLTTPLRQLISLTDLEFDYINPYESAKRINSVIFPEFIMQAALSFYFLVTGHWIMFLLCVPYLCYNVRIYTLRKHFVDVTEIFNMLNWEKKLRLVKLGYNVILLCFSLFWMLYSILED